MCQGNINIDYSIALKNNDLDGIYDGHLSSDETGMLAIIIIFLY